MQGPRWWEELHHRSNRNLPESAAANKLRPFAFPKKQTEKPDCRQAEDGARPKRGQHLAGDAIALQGWCGPSARILHDRCDLRHTALALQSANPLASVEFEVTA